MESIVPDHREFVSDELKSLKNIELSSGVTSDLAERWLPAIKAEVQSAQLEITGSVNSLRGVLQGILVVLVIIAITLWVK